MREDTTALAAGPGAEAGWFISAIWRRPVVDVCAIERLGQVADVVFDATTRRILGVRIEREPREHPLIEAAHRALAGAIGGAYISVAQIIALNEDVVTVDPERAPDADERLEGHSHLSQVQGFAVLTIAGKRLGRLVDIRVDGGGRNILSYLVRPGGHGVARSDVSLRPRRHPSWQQARPNGDEGSDPQAQREAAARGDPSLLVVPATHEVRVGRDLIIVVDPAETERHRAGDIPEPPAPEA